MPLSIFRIKKPRGHYSVESGRISGWAISPSDRPARVAIVIDGIEIGQVNALLPRRDVAFKYGAEFKSSGFEFNIPDHFVDGREHVVRLQVLPDRTELSGPNKPMRLSTASLMVPDRLVPLAQLRERASPRPVEHKARVLQPRIENLDFWHGHPRAAFLKKISQPLDVPVEQAGDVARVSSVMVVRNGPVIALGRGVVEEYCEGPLVAQQRWIARAARGSDHQHVAEPTVVIQRKGVDNYYHWMTEHLPKMLAAQELSGAAKAEIVAFQHAFIPSSLKYFGFASAVRNIRKVDSLVLDQAYLPAFQQKRKPTDTRVDGYLCRMHDLIRERASVSAKRGGRAIFVDRGDAQSRGVLNRDALLAALARRGIEPVTMSGYSVAQQAEIFGSADIIIGIHGAALTNLLFARPETKVLEIIPDALVPRIRCYLDISAVAGLRYSVYIEDSPMTEKENFEINLPNFERALEDIIAR